MPLEETTGLDLMVLKVWKSFEAENVGVIGLYGMGGVGKTTLLKKFNNQLVSRRQDFDFVMWIVVSKEPNLDSIMDNIRKKIGIEDNVWSLCSDRDEKAKRIYNVLKEKKFVLLLDDIWERLELKMVGIPHPKDINFQSKVLFTTRSEDVCAKMQAQKTFRVEVLPKKEAFELFCSKVGEETLNSHPGIPKLAEEMAAECKGLPLALNVVGSAMAGVNKFEEWEHYKNSLRDSPWIASDYEKNVFSILKFSFDKLPDETHRNCFLYCALYPEDHEILVLDLIDKWMGEGFLGEDTTRSIYAMRNHGESVIQKLKLSCLLESVEDDLFLSRTVKMHDVVRDMTLWLARDQDKNKRKILVQRDVLSVSQDDVETWRIVEKISIRDCDEFRVPTVPYPNLTTFIVNSCSNINNIRYMRRLKVLDLSPAWDSPMEIPIEIGDLALLEYLIGFNILASEFPMGLKKLKNLKFLSLNVRKGDASIMSEVISSLEQLRVFRFYSFTRGTSWGNEREFLEKLECLPNLEELVLTIYTENGLNKLLESTKLQSCMHFLHLFDVDDFLIHLPSLFASMSKMEHLLFISFIQVRFVQDSSVHNTCCLRKLRNVVLSACSSIVDLTWLKYAPLLQSVYIHNCESVEEVIKGSGIEGDVFSSLVELKLLSLPKLKSIHNTPLTFPSLRSLEISGCPTLKILPFDSNFAKHKLKEIKGKQEWWDNLEWEDQAIKLKFQSKFQIIRENLKSLEDKWEDLLSMKQDLMARIDEAEDTGNMHRTQEMDRWINQVEFHQENCKSSYKLGKKVAKILKNVDELATKGQRFSKLGEVAHKIPNRLAIEMPPDETVGLDLMFTKVWDSIEAETVGVIGLYGMGGVGKTTLLKKINNELGKRMLDFNLVMWIVVSKEPNLDSIMENIRKQIGIEDNIWNRCSNHDEKVGKIYHSLKQKKFVLLLDDIWESLELKMVGVPHPKDNNFQSKVLFTTRSKDVCAKMQAQSTFQVEILTEKESLELFFMKVGEETLKSHPNIPKLAKEMVVECKGLPLALIVVGSAMAGVKSVEAWEYSRNKLTSSSWTAPNLETKVFSILKFSFDKLLDEAHRNCFLYCALYPEDYEINVFDLIYKWIGEGFLSQDTGESVQDMRLHGESVIQKLKLSCLLESVEDDLFLSRKVKMHDVIRDMALWILRGQDKTKRKILVQEGASRVSPNDIQMWKTIERISIIDYDELHVPAVACPNLTTITFAMKKLGGPKTLDLSNIQYMSRLKVLDVSSSHPQKIIKLPAKFGDLVHLEYLSLMGDMSVIPTELKKLRNLKYIALYKSSDDVVSILLEVVSNLEELRVLRFNTSAKKNKEERKIA
ncbi:putative disease resistance protein [Senna tora]|uniref:Putative disease resistance protein n=1 Tax=Senna tora TaxID=362788 RepID=A0A834XEA1_9FABA|nr:putative disease resistance protein [Senna tora]